MLGIFLDTETNGLNFHKHRILEIAFTIIDLEKKKSIQNFHTIMKQPLEVWEQSDPISLSIHGIQYEELSFGLDEKAAAKKIITLFKEARIDRNQAVFICQNPSFDRSFFSQIIPSEEQEALNWPYHWLDLASMFWITYYHTHRSYPLDGGLSKDTIAHYYQLHPESKPHRALNGVNHLIECYYALIHNLA